MNTSLRMYIQSIAFLKLSLPYIYITLITNHLFQTILVSQLFLGHKSHDASLGGDLKVFDFCQVVINCVILAGFKKGFLPFHLIQMG